LTATPAACRLNTALKVSAGTIAAAPSRFEGCVAQMRPDRPDFIAMDGKTARRTHDRRKGAKALHTLSAYATTVRLVLAQRCVPEKTNEITAIPELLYDLADAGQLKGALVSIDAMGCQVEIAAKIVAHRADYLLALRGNQPTLEANVADYFRTAPQEELVSKTTVEKGHGRIETRTFTASAHVDWIGSDRRYPGETTRLGAPGNAPRTNPGLNPDRLGPEQQRTPRCPSSPTSSARTGPASGPSARGSGERLPSGRPRSGRSGTGGSSRGSAPTPSGALARRTRRRWRGPRECSPCQRTSPCAR
jgi:predicted transposase YbfD/YdcC